MSKKRIRMREFRINEISAVDNPAQAHAKLVLVKRDDPSASDKEDSVMPKGIGKSGDIDICESIAKMYIDASEGAMSFAEVLDLEMQHKEYYEMMDKVCPLIYAMETSLRSIAGDSSYSSDQKMNMMRDTVEGFMTTIRTKLEDAEGIIVELAYKLHEEPEMARTIKQLQEENEALKAQLEEALKASKTADNSEQLTELTEKLKTVNTELEAIKSERDAAVAKASLTEAERSFVETLDEDNGSEFMKMSSKARAAFMKTAEDTDEVLEIGGRTIRKSSVGDAAFETMKIQEDRLKAMEKSAQEERDSRINTELTKRAEIEFNHLPGTVDEKVSILKAANGLDESVQKALNTILKAADEAMSGAFTSFGVKDGKVTDIHKSKASGNSEHAFMHKVNDIKTTEKVSGSEAMSRARKRFPSEYEDFAGKEQNTA